MEKAPDKLPPAAGEKVFLLASSVWEKLRGLIERPQVALDPKQFSYTEDSTGIRTYRYTGGGGATLYHRILHHYRNSDGTVDNAHGDYQSMLFENGILKWAWSSYSSPDPEPAVPDTAFIVESIALIEVL